LCARLPVFPASTALLGPVLLPTIGFRWPFAWSSQWFLVIFEAPTYWALTCVSSRFGFGEEPRECPQFQAGWSLIRWRRSRICFHKYCVDG
jgi:hypothetical protein